MDLQLGEPQETELNMTPMIDIVFQLIIFFLLSLKFKTIDRRIESMMPKDRGPNPAPSILEEEDKIKVKLFRRGIADRERAFTLLKIDNAAQYPLPKGWKGRLKETPDRIERYDATVAAVKRAIEDRIAAYGGITDQIVGEIVAPPPRGGSVPHGDAVAVLNAFMEAGITNVKFEGTPTPLTSSERAARAAR